MAAGGHLQEIVPNVVWIRQKFQRDVADDTRVEYGNFGELKMDWDLPMTPRIDRIKQCATVARVEEEIDKIWKAQNRGSATAPLPRET
ncbi:hypothetical protein HAX54_010317 [Datura stramonium]|uniref:Uncharacterized protein n=1 Tax=Datura stramonium TaxID=4076 RepID=A0ABS8TG19_DATST|nr:hypothetical protein [Datura stramonium]